MLAASTSRAGSYDPNQAAIWRVDVDEVSQTAPQRAVSLFPTHDYGYAERAVCKDIEARKTRMAVPANFSRWLAHVCI